MIFHGQWDYKIITLMSQQDHHSGFDEEEENEAISHIKILASEIFTSISENSRSHFDDDDLIIQGLDHGQFHSHSERGDRKYSFTQRNYRNQNDKSLFDAFQFRELDERRLQQKQQKSKKRGLKKQEKVGKNPQNFKKKIVDKNKNNPKKETAAKDHWSIMRNQEHFEQIDQYMPVLVEARYMEPIGNMKESTVKDIYKKVVYEEIQLMKIKNSRRSLKTLNQLYSEKEPLYERYMREKVMRKMKIEESRQLIEDKQFEQFIGTPMINKNIKVKGSFDERLQKEVRKRETNKKKITYEIMEGSSFSPKVNRPPKYKNVSSKVKEIWNSSGKSMSYGNGNENENEEDMEDLKNISHSMLKTGSFFSDESLTCTPTKNKSFELKLKSAHELSNILQIDDLNEE